ncbi:MAG: ATP-binding cassette domain-containing protein [Ginsengibacter sp.]
MHTANGKMHLQVDLQIESGSFVSIYGSSGAGKTSILRMLAGFMQPGNGFIQLNDDTWFDSKNRINKSPQQRSIGFVFQDYALFPNMTVQENIAFGLRKNDDKKIVSELLELTGLNNFASRKIDALSGGQKQRVALARAIAKKPLLLLLDEPLSAIDNMMRSQLQTTLLELHRHFTLTTILVSHDMDEIVKLSDAVIHLEHGKVERNTTPASFFMQANDTSMLTGKVISIEDNGSRTLNVVLLNNRLIKVNSTREDVNFKVGDKVEVVYNDAVPLIRKL